MENLYNLMDNLWLKVENFVSKGEIARFEQFLLLSLCFQKAVCCRGVIKRQKASVWGKGLNTKQVVLFLLQQFHVWPTNNKGTDENNNAKIASSTSGTPQRIIKDCRYLRDYIYVPYKDYIATFQERRTSWQKKSDLSSYYQNYVANVRLQLS